MSLPMRTSRSVFQTTMSASAPIAIEPLRGIP
jgi:hypothetical protein